LKFHTLLNFNDVIPLEALVHNWVGQPFGELQPVVETAPGSDQLRIDYFPGAL